MPRKKRDKKSRSGRGALEENGQELVDEDASVCSSVAESEELSADSEEVVAATADVSVDDQQAHFQRLLDLLESIEEKSGPGRCRALRNFYKELKEHQIASFLDGQLLTVNEALLRCIRRGKPEEQDMAAHCLSLLFIQVAYSDQLDSLFNDAFDSLSKLVVDPSATCGVRTACCASVALGAFINFSDDPSRLRQCMDLFERVFRIGYLKGDGRSPALNPAQFFLCARALRFWIFLLTLLPTSSVKGLFESHVNRMLELLEATDLQLRLTTGYALALLYEYAHSERWNLTRNHRTLIERLRDTATEGGKHQRKVDNKEQRLLFRDVLYTVETGDTSELEKEIGKKDKVYLSSWRDKTWYDTFCLVLGSGLRSHLSCNEFLRDLFDLGPVIKDVTSNSSMSKTEKRRFHELVKSGQKISRAQKRQQKNESREAFDDS